jgi:hypothetical protein
MLDQQTPPQATGDDIRHDSNNDTRSTPLDTAKRWESSGIFVKTQRDLTSTLWRLRRQIVPHLVTGGVAGAGLAAHSIAAPGGMPAWMLALVTAAGGAMTTATAWKAMLRRRPRWANRVLGAGMFASAWLATTPFGVTIEQAGALLAADYAFGAAWWRANRIGCPLPDAIEEPAEEEITEIDEIVADWDQYVACDGGPLPKSRLVNPQITPHTQSFELEFWRGRQSLSTAFANLEKIAGGLDRDVDEIILEGPPKVPGQRRSAARARFQVITNSPIAGDVNFTGPRRDGGMLNLGPFADGAGDASWRLYTPGSMWSGVIIGGTGIGKSRLVENIAISALSGGDTIIIYVDPQGGVSSPALADNARVFIPGVNIDMLLEALLAGIAARGEENAAEGWIGFTASSERPGILTIIEECHRPFADKETAAKASYVAREGRKVGFALLTVSQYPGLVTFGNNEALRSSIMEGNGIVLRSTSNQTKGLMPGLDVDPKTLPKIPGYGYILGSAENGSRTAPFRNRDTGDDSEATGRWLAAQPAPQIDPLLANAFARSRGGFLFDEVDDATAQRRDLARARVEAMRNGLDPDVVAPRPTVALTRPAPTAAATDEELGELIEFPRALTAEQVRTPHRPTRTEELSASQQAVLEAVALGATRPSEIEEHTGLKHRRVAELLKELVAAGYLTQPRYGRYERAA